MSAIASHVRRNVLVFAVGCVVAINLGLMAAFPSVATVPFHIAWISLIVMYGLRSWGHLPTDVVAVGLSLVTALILWKHAADGAIDAEEIAQAPLMGVAFRAMTWHIRCRQAAMDQAVLHARAERDLREETQALARRTCHDLRNPLTVARGYVELIRMQATDPGIRDDTQLVIHEMDRMAAITTRLRG
jgi:two-component system, OmpR family, sensor kinase